MAHFTAGDGGAGMNATAPDFDLLLDPDKRDVEIARVTAEASAREAEMRAHSDAAWAELERQDDDFRALEFALSFACTDIPGHDGERLTEDSRFDWIELSDDDHRNAQLTEALKVEISAAIKPHCDHFRQLGLIRADNLMGSVPGTGEASGAPTFYLVYNANDEAVAPESLCSLTNHQADLQAVPGAVLTWSAGVQPFNATTLFNRAREHGLLLGEWASEDATPATAPAPYESRDVWLKRVAIPVTAIQQNVARWRRSGGNLELFKAVGAASGDAARERPIRWLIPGLIPRGYVSLLVGTKQAGKSTLLGEMLAVIDSECASPRLLLGTEITERGIGCLVSGEDGIDFVASRNAYYEPVHGIAQGFAFATADRPWTEILARIDEIPNIDIIGIDPLRAVMPGNEDSSEAISQFLDQLNALAQRKDCAIVLVHHLSKATVRSFPTMLQAVRGSGAITDRPRMVIGMIDRGSGVSEIAVIKQNIPPSETLWGEVNVGRLFRRDKDTLTLVPVDAAPQRSERRDATTPVLDVIAEAVEHQNRLGAPLRRTGKSELFERKVPQLAGMSRSFLREAIATLLAAGRLEDGPDGLKATDTAAGQYATQVS